MRRLSRVSAIAFLVAAASLLAFGQATVNESLETATLYVDANSGNDNAAGTASQPLKTISAALSTAASNNRSGIGTNVIVNPGLYRESISIGNSTRDTASPITVQAATPGTAVVTGAVQYTGWQTYSGNPSLYTVYWPNSWGFCPASVGGPTPQPIVMRQEMIFVNGTPLTQVLSLAQMVYPGSFFVDESHAAVYIWPPSGTKMATADVEVATLPTLLSVSGHDNMVFRGLTFEYANTCRDSAAAVIYSTSYNVLLDQINFVWNNAAGLQITNPVVNFTVQNSVANHNGQSGLKGTMTKSGLWQNNTASFNNWRGAQGAYYVWNTAGAHFFESHNDTVNGLTLAYNQTHGVHWDTDNANITVTGLKSVQNLANGIMVEVSQGPVSIDSSYACNNDPAPHDSSAYQGGLLLRNSQNVSFTNSTLYNNGTAQVDMQGQAGGIAGVDWETGASYNLVTQNLNLSQNVIYGTGAQPVFSNSVLGGADWSTFQTTLLASKNTYYNATTPKAFIVPSPVNATTDGFSDWQGVTGQDLSSSWAKPADPTTACTVAADAPDYWLIAGTGQSTISQIGGATSNFYLVPIGGFSGTVNFAVDASQAPGISATLSSPSASGSATETVTFAASTSVVPGTYPVTLIGNNGNTSRAVTINVVVPQTGIRLSTGSLAFSSQVVGSVSSRQNFTVTNIGTTAITFSAIATGSSFGATSNCSTLAAGASCTVTVTFSPLSGKSFSSQVILTDSDATVTQSVSVTGTGLARPSITLSPGTLSFGSNKVGTKSVVKTTTLTNTSTTSSLNISSLALTGSYPGDYTQTNTCGASLAPGANCSFSVTFTAGAKGSRNATITIYENTSVGKHSVTLTGSGS